MAKKDKTEYEEHWLLPLLKKVPTFETNEEEHEKWSEEAREAISHLLGFYEEENQIHLAIEELKEEIKELQSKLERHKHLEDGTAVGRI